MRGIIAAALVAGVFSAATAADKPTIAVLTFKGVNTSGGDAEAVTQFVRTAVVKSGEFIVVDKDNIDKVLSEQAFQQTGCTSADCAVKLGKVLNAKKVFVGKYTVFEGARLISAEIVDVETGRIEASESQNITDVAKIEQNAGELVDKLLDAMASGGPAPARRARRESRPDERDVAHGGKFGIGINFTGAGIRVFPFNRFAAEARVQFQEDILVVGGRLQKYFSFFRDPLVYVGVEGDYVDFKDGGSEGTGYAAMGMVGAEYFFWRDHMGLSLDFGPAWVNLDDESAFKVSVDGIEFVVNFGITYYFN